MINKIKKLLAICATLAVFSCAPQPVAAEEVSLTCMTFSGMATAVHNAKKAGVPEKTIAEVISDSVCSDRVCEARKRLNLEILSIAYSSKLTAEELKAVYNLHCMQRLNIFY